MMCDVRVAKLPNSSLKACSLYTLQDSRTHAQQHYFMQDTKINEGVNEIYEVPCRTRTTFHGNKRAVCFSLKSTFLGELFIDTAFNY